ncbi:MAG: hypothetical protein CM15mV42_1750 [uncultured marine virus]|nr:MAG: hypothetical protein CM15mV42_1750 [uncultured marine virus]
MITTAEIKKQLMTPKERKAKVAELRKEHEDHFQTIGNINALYIPKMAYRPPGKDELHVSFFPSELQKGKDIFTEFVSIDYDSEDPKRTLYLLKYNAHWEEEYELVKSNSGFERHIIPVKELITINDVVSRKVKEDPQTLDLQFDDLIKDPDKRDIVDVLIGIEKALLSINQKLEK